MTLATLSPHIITNLKDSVLELEISRREKKNALNGAMYLTLAHHLTEAANNPAVNVVYIHGQEDLFTSGNDLHDFLNRDLTGPSPASVLLKVLTHYKKIIVAAVGGNAIGIGTTLLLHCDIAIASTQVRFQMPFVNLGACPEGGSSAILQRTGGQKLSSELLMLGDFFSAEKAQRAGIVNDIFPPEDLLSQGMEIAKRLAQKPQDALRTTKQLLKQGAQLDMDVVFEREFEQFARLLGTPVSREIVTAFLEKRAPDTSLFNHVDL
jgi:enoyl-CoA hydratase/carnithine racemase